MKETYGVPVEEIQEAIKHGVRKINIDTDIRLAMTGAVRKFLAENPDKFDAARLAQAGARGGLQGLQAALPGVRLRRPGGKIKPMTLARGGRAPTAAASCADGGLSAPAGGYFFLRCGFQRQLLRAAWPWWCLSRSASTPSSLQVQRLRVLPVAARHFAQPRR